MTSASVNRGVDGKGYHRPRVCRAPLASYKTTDSSCKKRERETGKIEQIISSWLQHLQPSILPIVVHLSAILYIQRQVSRLAQPASYQLGPVSVSATLSVLLTAVSLSAAAAVQSNPQRLLIQL